MGYLLLWIENAAVALVLMAWVIACIGRWQRRGARAALGACATLAMLLFYGYLAAYAAILQFTGTPGFHWFYYALALAIAVIVGTFALRTIGLRRTSEIESPTTAARWPRGKLLSAWLVLLGLHAFTIASLDRAADRQLDAIRSDAVALLRAEAPAPVPDNQNAAVLYAVAAAAFSDLVSWRGKEEHWMDDVLASFDPKDPELIRFMQERGFIARILREAAARPTCVIEPGLGEPFPPCGRSFYGAWVSGRDLAMLLALDCRWNLAKGDRRAALQDIDALFRFSEHVSAAGLVGPANHAHEQATGSLQYLLSVGQPTAEELQLIRMDQFWSCRRSELRNWPGLNARLRWCVQGWGGEDDFARDYAIYEYYSPSLGTIDNSPWYRVFLLQSDLATLDLLSSEVEGELCDPYWLVAKRRAERPSLREKLLSTGSGPPGVTVTEFAAQFLGDTPQSCAVVDARHARAVVALAVARYRAKEGRLPESLDALVPEFLATAPRDPFDGKAIRWKQTDRAAIIYSIGPDMVDDGGVPLVEETLKGDLVFELPGEP